MPAQETLQKKYDIEQFIEAVAVTAEHIGAEYDKDVMRRPLTVLREPFEAGFTAYRTTTAHKRTINLRYINLLVPFYPFDIALKNGLIKNDGHPSVGIIPTFMNHLGVTPSSGIFGVDVGAATGLEKIWFFFPNSVPLAEFLKIPGLPGGVKAHVDYFKKHQLDVVKLIGVDFPAKSINLYFFAWEIGGLTPKKSAGLLGDLGLNVPNDEVLQHCARALPLYYTFKWDSPEVQRVCFGCFAPEPALVPKWSPIIDDFVANAITMINQRAFMYNPTFNHNGQDFTKIEIGFDEFPKFIQTAPAENPEA